MLECLARALAQESIRIARSKQAPDLFFERVGYAGKASKKVRGVSGCAGCLSSETGARNVMPPPNETGFFQEGAWSPNPALRCAAKLAAVQPATTANSSEAATPHAS